MTERILTVSGLTDRAPRPGLYQLRVMDRQLRARIDELDARVDALLVLDGPPTDAQVGEVDVLCAAIAELRELRDEARHEAAEHVQRRHRRRSRPRRWA